MRRPLQLRGGLLTYCGEAIVVKGDSNRRKAVTLKCRAWTCQDCAPRRKARLVAQAVGGAPTSFITLTHRRTPGLTPEAAATRLARAWRLVRLRVMRDRGWRKLPFIAVFERHKSGWPHLHIMARCGYIDQKFISEVMTKLLASPIVHITMIKNKQMAAAYSAKYISKDPRKFGTCKRYWQSQDYDLRQPYVSPHEQTFPGTWQRERTALDTWCTTMFAQGYYVERIGTNEAVAMSKWQRE